MSQLGLTTKTEPESALPYGSLLPTDGQLQHATQPSDSALHLEMSTPPGVPQDYSMGPSSYAPEIAPVEQGQAELLGAALGHVQPAGGNGKPGPLDPLNSQVASISVDLNRGPEGMELQQQHGSQDLPRQGGSHSGSASLNQPQQQPAAQQQQGSWLTLTTAGGVTLGYVRVDDPERDLSLKDVRELVDDKIRETAEYANGWVFAKTGNQQLIVNMKDEAGINAVELCPTIAVIPAQAPAAIPQGMPGPGLPNGPNTNPIPTGMPGYNSIPGMPGMQIGPNGMPMFNPLMLQHQLMLQAQRAEKLRQNHVSCPICGRLFGQSSDVKRHMRTHDRLKPFKCPFCPKAYTQRGTLYRHSKSKHGKQIRVARTKEILQGTVAIPGVDTPAPAPVPVTDNLPNLQMPPMPGFGGGGGMGMPPGMPPQGMMGGGPMGNMADGMDPNAMLGQMGGLPQGQLKSEPQPY